jgi:uncharacterized protein YndB with AHSA1/START domain
MHCSFRVGATTLMASDGCSADAAKFEGFSLSFSAINEAEANRAFAALADGGQVRMPLTKTFWSPCFGMVVDRFGLSWMVTVLPSPAVSTPFVISRTFAAPPQRVWKAWTDREQLLRWFGPKGFAMTTAKMDLRPGGSFHYCLKGPDGEAMWGKFAYRELVAPERIVLVSSFSDEHGGLTRHPFAPTWPLEMLSTTTLVEEGDKTKLTIECSPLDPSEEERRTFDASHDGMKQGWTGSMDQLAAFLAPE